MSGLKAVKNLNCSALPQSLDSSVCIGGYVGLNETKSGKFLVRIDLPSSHVQVRESPAAEAN
jgi:hypothetical protein